MVPRQLTGGLRPRDALLEFALSLCLLLPFLVQASLAQNVSIPSGQNGSDVVKSPIKSVDETEEIDLGQVLRDVVAAGLSKVPRSLVRRLLTADVRFECSTSFLRTMRAFQNHEPWALRLLDATGKYPTGTMEVSRVDMGAYDECLATEVRDRTGNVLSRGQYCNLLVYAKNAAAMQAIVNISLEALHPTTLQLAGWCVSVSCGLFCVFVKFPWYSKGYPASDSVEIIVAFLDRIVWSVSLAWITLACSTGRGGPVNKFLSWNAFVPLSKLSYGVYLIHLPLFKLMMHSSRERVYFSEFYQGTLYFGVLTWCLVFSYFVYVACEAPTAALDKVIFGRLTRGAIARSQQRQEQQLESGDLNTLSGRVDANESSPR
ncbi:hypothetical protein MTO96_019739 [Rhipicephalus appendiculatus]